MSSESKSKPPFWESARNRKLMWTILYASCALTLVMELFVHAEHHFHFMEYPFSSAVVGFGMCTLMIIAAKGLGYVLKKKEHFYDEDDRI